uniref:ApoC-I n=1 Tax=Steinernema glaseri TaxID=37863 RepID=A0A1I8ATU9_9BILA
MGRPVILVLLVVSLALADPVTEAPDVGSDVPWKELMDAAMEWAKHQSFADLWNFGAFYRKVVGIQGRVGRIVEDSREKLSPEATEALRKVMSVISDPNKGLMKQAVEVRSEVERLSKEDQEQLLQFLIDVIAEYLKKYGNPLLGDDSILGKQSSESAFSAPILLRDVPCRPNLSVKPVVLENPWNLSTIHEKVIAPFGEAVDDYFKTLGSASADGLRKITALVNTPIVGFPPKAEGTNTGLDPTRPFDFLKSIGDQLLGEKSNSYVGKFLGIW